MEENTTNGRKLKGYHITDMNKTRRMSNKQRGEQGQPPDGGWGWIVVLASFLVHLLVDGIAYSFGIFYFEFLEYYKGGKGETAWVGSLTPSVTLVFGPVASVLTEKYGCRITTAVGSLIAAAGFVLSIFSPNLHFLYFTFGILSGLGFSLIYLPAVVSVGHYFENKRAFAVGLASCGSGIGAFIFNPFTKFLIDEYGWRGAVLIQAGIILNCAVCGSVFRPLKAQTLTKNDPKSSTSDKHVDQLGEDIPLTVRKRNDFHEVHETPSESYSPVSILNQNNYNDPLQEEAEMDQEEDVKRDLTKKVCCFDIPADFIISVNKVCDFSQLKDALFILFVVSNGLASLGLIIPFVFVYDFAIYKGIDEDSAKWLGSVIGIINTCGRAISGLLADRQKVNKQVVFSVALTICGTATALCSWCSTYTLLVLFSCVFGLFYGIHSPLRSVVLVDILGLEMLNNSFGVLIMFKGIACLISPPLIGWLFDVTGSYTASFITAGLTTAASGILLLLTPVLRRCRRHKGNQTEVIEDEQLNKNNEK